MVMIYYVIMFVGATNLHRHLQDRIMQGLS